MTWHKSAFPAAVALQVKTAPTGLLGVLLIGVLAACGSSSKNASITITAPEKGAVLTSKDDADKNKNGLQYTVTAASTDVAPGTDVILRIEGESDAPLAEVGRDGSIEFKNVTLPRGKRTLQVTTGNGGIGSPDDWEYTHKALVIESPMDARVISSASDDKDPELEGVQINVTVKTFAIDMTEDVVLQVDKEPVGSPLRPNSSETLMFTGITLSNGEHTLVAVAGEVESDPVRISVNANCADITFVQPMVPSDGSDVVLGGGDQCPEPNQQFRTNFQVSTNAGNGRNVDLYVNGTLAGNARVDGTVVTFEDVVLDRYNTPNEVEVVVETAQNMKCAPVKYPVAINLDCEGVDCSISAPKPVAGDDGDGKRVQYLNGSHKSGDGFDFEVHTDADAIGRPVRLFIDGRETDAPEADPEGSDPDVKALFKGIKLDDGEHTIVARCEHESGTFGLSRTASWIVDTKACGVDIQSPSADMLLVPGFDEDGNLSGVQIELEADITGDDCRRARTSPCNPDDGIAEEVGYEDFDGQSPLRTLVTLANEAEQNLCLDVLDRAGNKGSDHVAVRYTPTAPKLLIETPADGDRYNAQGGNGYQKDTDASSASVCNAHFDVACSELGSTVRLHRDDANGTVFGMAMCEPRADGDRELPDGYEGRARIRNAAFLSGNNDTVTVVATQRAGSATQIGESPAITLRGDCEVPALAFTGTSPCEQPQIGVAGETSTVTRDIAVADSTLDTQSARLTVTSEGDVSFMRDAAISSGAYTFNDAELGGPGEGGYRRDITITVTADDDFGNRGTLTCNTAVVGDLPVLMVATPADNAFFQTIAPRSAELCVPTTGGEGLQIVATADVAADRTAAVSVNGDPDIALTLTDTSITGCVPIDPGPNELVFKLTSTRTSGTALVTRQINLVTAVPDTGVTMNPATAPADRTGRATFSWTLPTEQFPGQFVSYQLRCGTRAYDAGAGAEWLAASRNVPLPSDFKPPTATVEVEMRVGEEAHCLVQAVDAAGQLTRPIASTNVRVPFREARFAGTTADVAMGRSFKNVGDVNGDDVDDLLVGGLGRAYLIFGNAGGWSSATPNVTFNAGTASSSYLGESVAAIGDFNGDGERDFALGEWFKSAASPTTSGRVYVFFGRSSSDSWPSTVDLSSASSCGADICFTAASASFFGFSVSPAGNFDNDPQNRADLAVGAQTFGGDAGRLYVLLGSDAYTSGSRTGSFYGVTVPVESGDARRGFAFDGPAGSRLGTSVVSVGAFDGAAGEDLVVSAQGAGNGSPAGALYLISGRTYAGPGLVELASSELGTPFDSGETLQGFGVYALGNAYQPEGSTEAKVDIGVYTFGETGYVLYSGETNFDPAQRVRVSAASGGATFFGTSVCTGADLDGDGLTEQCAAGELDITDGTAPGTAYLWYSDNFALQLRENSSPFEVITEAATVLDPPVSGTVDPTPLFVRPGARVVDFVGDLNGDGRLDMAVATPSMNDSAGEITILY